MLKNDKLEVANLRNSFSEHQKGLYKNSCLEHQKGLDKWVEVAIQNAITIGCLVV